MDGPIRQTNRRQELPEYIDTVFTRLLSPGLFPLRLPGFASQCAVCRSWPARQVCPPCEARFAPAQRRCERCALALPADLPMELQVDHSLCRACMRQPPPLDRVLAAYLMPTPGLT